MKMVKLESISEIQTGGTPSTSINAYWENGNIPWLQSGCCQNCYVSSSNSYITKLGYDNSSAKMMKKDTILIALTGATAGKVGHLTFEACGNQSITGITLKSSYNPRYIFHYLISRRPKILHDCIGGAQPHISQGYVKNIKVPLISREEQDLIAEKIDKIVSILESNKNLMFYYDELVKSRFIELFGDPIENSKNLKTIPLKELGILERGRSQHRPRNDASLLNGPYPLIQTGDVKNADTYITKYASTYSEKGLKQSKMWKKGTLCITIAANIAETAILGFDACFPDSVVGFRPNDNVTTIFIHNWFKFLQPILEEKAPSVAQKNLNLEILGNVEVIVPKIDLQTDFENSVKQIDKLKFSRLVENSMKMKQKAGGICA